MSRYFFHVYHDAAQVDQEGEELPDKHAAWKEATDLFSASIGD